MYTAQAICWVAGRWHPKTSDIYIGPGPDLEHSAQHALLRVAPRDRMHTCALRPRGVIVKTNIYSMNSPVCSDAHCYVPGNSSACCRLVTHAVHTSCQYIPGRPTIPTRNLWPKGAASAKTVFRRACLLARTVCCGMEKRREVAVERARALVKAEEGACMPL